MATLLLPHEIIQNIAPKPEIKQLGISGIVIDSRTYKIALNNEAIIKVALILANLRNGNISMRRAQDWFSKNTLEAELLNYDSIDAFGSIADFQTPKQTGTGNPRIRLTREAIKNIYKFQSQGIINNPNDVFDHELIHLDDWINNPYYFDIEKRNGEIKLGWVTATLVSSGITTLYKRKKSAETALGILTMGGLGYLALNYALPNTNHDRFFKNLPLIIHENPELFFNSQKLLTFTPQ